MHSIIKSPPVPIQLEAWLRSADDLYFMVGYLLASSYTQ